jgi:hypothetical protein
MSPNTSTLPVEQRIAYSTIGCDHQLAGVECSRILLRGTAV